MFSCGPSYHNLKEKNKESSENITVVTSMEDDVNHRGPPSHGHTLQHTLKTLIITLTDDLDLFPRWFRIQIIFASGHLPFAC